MPHLPARIFPGQNPARPARARRAATRVCFTCTNAANPAASHETYQLSRVRFANKSPSRQLSGLRPSGRIFSHTNSSRHKTERDDVGYFQWPVLIVTFIFALLAIFIYMIPSILAEERRHRNLAAIVVLNLLLGWTFLGWVGALIWAIIRPRQPE
jgi:hypothetical protein